MQGRAESRVETNYPLAALNTWKTGGRCSFFCAPTSAAELSEVVSSQLLTKDIYILGGGSNILIADGQIDALVVHTPGLNKISLRRDPKCGSRVEMTAECGVGVKTLLAVAFANRLGGLEFLAGIPGTLGGALWGNAGAGGKSFASCVKTVETLERGGELRVWGRQDLHWKYRACPWTSDTLVITKCILSLEETSVENIKDAIRKYSALKKGQPLGRATAGCVFKNPEGSAAGALLERAGCKGMRVGGAMVSPCHANFIENVDNASAEDIFSLSELCRKKVAEQFGINLEYEIRMLGGFEKKK